MLIECAQARVWGFFPSPFKCSPWGWLFIFISTVSRGHERNHTPTSEPLITRKWLPVCLPAWKSTHVGYPSISLFPPTGLPGGLRSRPIRFLLHVGRGADLSSWQLRGERWPFSTATPTGQRPFQEKVSICYSISPQEAVRWFNGWCWSIIQAWCTERRFFSKFNLPTNKYFHGGSHAGEPH